MATTDVLLSDPFILNNCISALSNMNNNHDKPKDSHLYTYANKHTRRCVDLLSGLSLLLVRGDKGECCAVTVVRKSTNEAVIRVGIPDFVFPLASSKSFDKTYNCGMSECLWVAGRKPLCNVRPRPGFYIHFSGSDLVERNSADNRICYSG